MSLNVYVALVSCRADAFAPYYGCGAADSESIVNAMLVKSLKPRRTCSNALWTSTYPQAKHYAMRCQNSTSSRSSHGLMYARRCSIVQCYDQLRRPCPGPAPALVLKTHSQQGASHVLGQFIKHSLGCIVHGGASRAVGDRRSRSASPSRLPADMSSRRRAKHHGSRARRKHRHWLDKFGLFLRTYTST
jgi:hypothetical protein